MICVALIIDSRSGASWLVPRPLTPRYRRIPSALLGTRVRGPANFRLWTASRLRCL